MSDDSGKTKKLSLSGSKLTLGAIDASKLRTGTAVGAGRKTVQVEVRRKRAPAAPSRTPAAAEAPPVATSSTTASTTPAATSAATGGATAEQIAPSADDRLTAQERAARVRALQEGLKKPAAETVPGDAVPGDASVAGSDDIDSTSAAAEVAPAEAAAPLDPAARRRAAELAELEEIEAEEAKRRAEEARKNSEHVARHQQATEERTSTNAFRAAPQAPTPSDVASRRRREAALRALARLRRKWTGSA